jgi:hypothetical protein
MYLFFSEFKLILRVFGMNKKRLKRWVWLYVSIMLSIFGILAYRNREYFKKFIEEQKWFYWSWHYSQYINNCYRLPIIVYEQRDPTFSDFAQELRSFSEELAVEPMQLFDLNHQGTRLNDPEIRWEMESLDSSIWIPPGAHWRPH